MARERPRELERVALAPAEDPARAERRRSDVHDVHAAVSLATFALRDPISGKVQRSRCGMNGAVSHERLIPAVRRARQEEARALLELAVRSKAHWGYSGEFLRRWREVMEIDEGFVARNPVFVAEVGGRPVGFHGVSGAPPEGTLDVLFVEPSFIGRGVGRLLWEHALVTARELGFTRLLIESEPEAEGFYLRMGAVRVGSSTSPLDPSRILPVLRVVVTDEQARNPEPTSEAR